MENAFSMNSINFDLNFAWASNALKYDNTDANTLVRSLELIDLLC